MENVIDSVRVAEILNIKANHLRQLVHKKVLVPVGKEKRRSLFNATDVEQVRAVRSPSTPSA